MLEAKKAIKYGWHVMKEASGFGAGGRAVSDMNRDALRRHELNSTTTETSPSIITPVSPGRKRIVGEKIARVGFQLVFPAIERVVSTAENRPLEPDDKPQSRHDSLKNYMGFTGLFTDTAQLIATYLVRDEILSGETRFVAGAIIVKGMYNVGVQVFPDALDAGYCKGEALAGSMKKKTTRITKWAGKQSHAIRKKPH